MVPELENRLTQYFNKDTTLLNFTKPSLTQTKWTIQKKNHIINPTHFPV